MVRSARAQGISVLLVEQNVRAAVEVVDRAYVLDDGHIVYEGSSAEFGADEKRVRALAGASAEEWDLVERYPHWVLQKRSASSETAIPRPETSKVANRRHDHQDPLWSPRRLTSNNLGRWEEC